MLTCMYQPPVSLGKVCLLKVNCETKKVIVSKFCERGSQVKVELLQPKFRKSSPVVARTKLISKSSEESSFEEIDYNFEETEQENETDQDSDDSSCSLPETCGLSLSELEGMAARQARQLETQEQLLAAKAQRLRYLKSGGEAERLQRLREKVAIQEERLRKLRALRGKVQTNRSGNAVLSSDLESLRAVFNEKEKELSIAAAKCDELTRQLEDLRKGCKESNCNNGSNMASVELEKLRRELSYRQKLREAQATRVAAQRAALSQRQEESARVDRRIAELQERLHRKRLLNHQLAATLKHQENVEDFVVGNVPNKNDPKYQTLPYNAKLFTPFGNKQQQYNSHQNVEQEKYDKAIQKMQIISLDQQKVAGDSNDSKMIHSMNEYTNNLQVSSYMSQNPNSFSYTKSANGAINNFIRDNFSQSQHIFSNGLNYQNEQLKPESSHNIMSGMNGSGGSNKTFSLVRPSNFLPTGAPSPALSAQNIESNGFSENQIGVLSTGKDGTSSLESNGSVSESSCDGNSICDSNSKPALPPKPTRPGLPVRTMLENTSTSRNDTNAIMPDRSELPIKAKPLFLKKTSLPAIGNNVSLAGSHDKDNISNNNASTVRISINRRIEMPPAFLFPESDPPPSDLVPEHPSSTNSSISSSSTSSIGGGGNSVNGTETRNSSDSGLVSSTSAGSHDCLDTAQFFHQYESSSKSTSNSLMQHFGNNVEEYTLPDLFPQPPSILLSNNKTGPTNNNSSIQTINNNHSPSKTSPDSTEYNNQLNNNDNLDIQNSSINSPTYSQSSYNNNVQNHEQNLFRYSNQTNNDTGDWSNTVVNSNSTENNDGQLSFSSLPSPLERDELPSPPPLNHLEGFKTGNDSVNQSTEQGSESDDKSASSTCVSEKTNGPASVPGIIRRVKKGNLKSNNNKESSANRRRVSFDPLALLLDASLEGELELVMKTANEVGNPSAANDEGITALHNAICAGHSDVVRFLVEFGCDVNAQDSDGWTPLHCAASCNNVGMVKFLVEHGACIFATTLSDHETAAEKCEEDEDGYGPCSEYLYSIQEKLGIINNGVVYGVFDYGAQNPDELSFREGERLTILRKGDEYEREWWWTKNADETQGYVPRNLLGLYPRVVPQHRITEA